MKFINAISNWLKRINERSKAACQERRIKQLENISCKSINVTEFNGRVYISYEGVPIVRVDDLKTKVPDTLAQAREDYLAWMAKFNA